MSLYARLAWDGIRKNKRLYVPYLLTCIGAVMMFYILNSLSRFMITSGSFGFDFRLNPPK